MSDRDFRRHRRDEDPHARARGVRQPGPWPAGRDRRRTSDLSPCAAGARDDSRRRGAGRRRSTSSTRTQARIRVCSTRRASRWPSASSSPAMGRGNVPPAMVDGIDRWIAEDKPVVITSRALRGRVGHTYGYPGGGRRLAERGAIFAGARRPQQARIDVMLALGSGMSASPKSASLFERRADGRWSSTCSGFPALEAAPVVLLGRADLIGEAETVRPTFLLGAPAAVPDELVDARLAGGMHLDRPDEIGAPGPPTQARSARSGRCGSADSIWASRRRTLIVRREAFDPDVISRRRSRSNSRTAALKVLRLATSRGSDSNSLKCRPSE